MHAAIFGNVTAIIHGQYSSNFRYRKESLQINEFVRYFKIKNPLARRLRDYSRHTWSQTKGTDMAKVCITWSYELCSSKANDAKWPQNEINFCAANQNIKENNKKVDEKSPQWLSIRFSSQSRTTLRCAIKVLLTYVLTSLIKLNITDTSTRSL